MVKMTQKERERSRNTSNRYHQRRQAKGQVRTCVWVPDNDEAKEKVREFAAKLVEQEGN